MSKLRSLNTSIWTDVWFEGLSTNEKLLFVYLITNERTNMLGVYEISKRKISFETGINNKDIDLAFKKFEISNKILYKMDRVVLLNFLKHQNYNLNMMKSAIDCYNNLPAELKIPEISVLERTQKAFETLCKGFGMVRKEEKEDESEEEKEDESEDEKPPAKKEIPTLQEFMAYYQHELSHTFPNREFSVQAKYESWVESGWKNGNGKKIINWKTSLKNTISYLKPQNNGTFTQQIDPQQQLINRIANKHNLEREGHSSNPDEEQPYIVVG